jgi:hypothetical protein
MLKALARISTVSAKDPDKEFKGKLPDFVVDHDDAVLLIDVATHAKKINFSSSWNDNIGILKKKDLTLDNVLECVDSLIDFSKNTTSELQEVKRRIKEASKM